LDFSRRGGSFREGGLGKGRGGGDGEGEVGEEFFDANELNAATDDEDIEGKGGSHDEEVCEWMTWMTWMMSLLFEATVFIMTISPGLGLDASANGRNKV
jgi:hypothetical protein